MTRRRILSIGLNYAPEPIGIGPYSAALRMARGAGLPLWLHVKDFEVGAALATGLIERDSRAAIAIARFQDRMLHSANLVSTISHPMCQLLECKGVTNDRILEMRNWGNHTGAIARAPPCLTAGQILSPCRSQPMSAGVTPAVAGRAGGTSCPPSPARAKSRPPHPS